MYSPALDEGYGTATRPMPSASDRAGRINQDGPKTKGAFPGHMVTEDDAFDSGDAARFLAMSGSP